MKTVSSYGIVAFFFFALLAGLVLGSPRAWSQELAQRTSPRLMQGVRPLGMGGGFIGAKGTDENALFYNPAAIADFPKEFHWQFWIPAFTLPTVEFSAKAIPFFASDLPGLSDDIDLANSDSEKIDVFNAFTNKHTGRYEELGLRGNVVQVMHRHFTGAIIYDSHSVLALTNPASSTFDVESVTHFGVQFGSAAEFLDERLQAGAALKFLGRHIVNETITQREIVANSDFADSLDLNNLGFGVGVDLGVKARPPVPFKPWGKVWSFLDPVFAMTLQDLGHTRFSNNTGQINESFTMGLALHPADNLWKLKSLFTFDVRDLDRRTDFITKLYTGYELTWPELSRHIDALSARIGLAQGYLSGGLGMDFDRFKFNVATYGREIAAHSRQKQSRMFSFQVAYGF